MGRQSLLLTIHRVGEENRVTLRDWAAESPIILEYPITVPDMRLRELNQACERLVMENHLRRAGQIRKEEMRADTHVVIDGGEVPTEDMKVLGQQLSARLLPKPIQERLRTLQPGELDLSVDSSLVHLPWELCHDGQMFLAHKFHVGRRVISPPGDADVQDTTYQLPSPVRVLVVIDPTETLPEAIQEGEAVCKLLRGNPEVTVTLLAGKRVRQEKLLQALEKYDVVHFAGHSEYNPLALEKSGWKLADGVLAFAEFRRLARPPRLVFSNSCQAGATSPWQDSSHAVGIGSAFLIAGVKNYIGTFWSVHDKESRGFATAFYQSLVAGATLGQALQDARQTSEPQQNWRQLTGLSYMLYGSPSARLWPGKEKSGEKEFSRSRSPLVAVGAGVLTLCVIAVLLAVSYRPTHLHQEQSPSFAPSPKGQVGIVSPIRLDATKLSNGVVTPLLEGDSLTQRDRYVITVTPAQNLFLYVVQQDASGNITPLFPDPQAWPSEPITQGTPVHVPDGDERKGLEVTGPAGEEVIIALGSAQRLPGLESQLEELEVGRGARRVQLTALEAAQARQDVYQQTLKFQNKVGVVQ